MISSMIDSRVPLSVVEEVGIAKATAAMYGIPAVGLYLGKIKREQLEAELNVPLDTIPFLGTLVVHNMVVHNTCEPGMVILPY